MQKEGVCVLWHYSSIVHSQVVNQNGSRGVPSRATMERALARKIRLDMHTCASSVASSLLQNMGQKGNLGGKCLLPESTHRLTMEDQSQGKAQRQTPVSLSDISKRKNSSDRSLGWFLLVRLKTKLAFYIFSYLFSCF